MRPTKHIRSRSGSDSGPAHATRTSASSATTAGPAPAADAAADTFRGQKRPRTRSDSTASGSQSSAGDRPSCSQGSARSNSPDRDDELHESSSSRVPNRPSVRFEHDDAEEERVRGDLALRGLPTTNDFVLFSTLLRHSSVIDEPFRMAIEVLGGMHANSAGEHARTNSGGMSSEEKARLRTDMRPVTKLLVFTPRWTTTHGTVFFDMLKWALERTKVIRPDVSNSSYHRDVKECLVKVLAEVCNDFTKLVKNEYDKNPLTAVRKWFTGTERTIWREHLVFWTLLVEFHDERFVQAKSDMSSRYHGKTFLEGFEIFLEKEVIEELANAQLDCRGAFDWCNYLWTGKFSVYKDRLHDLDAQLLEPDVTGMAWFRSSRSAGGVDNIQTLLYTRMRSNHAIDLKHAIDRRVEKKQAAMSSLARPTGSVSRSSR